MVPNNLQRIPKFGYLIMGCFMAFLAAYLTLERSVRWQLFAYTTSTPWSTAIETVKFKEINLLNTTASDFQHILESKKLTSVELVKTCIEQIRTYDAHLKAMLSISPQVLEVARALDNERSQGQIRGPLHGIPILIKDNINTGDNLGMHTTAGSYALEYSEAIDPAPVINSLRQAGAIILGKTQLSEFANYKGTGLPGGWSALGGQCRSAYTTDTVQPGDGILGYSSPGGSSTGSAVGVSAGYAPIGLGTDTTGSVVIPATRAALYAIRTTPENVPRDGIVPFSRIFDSIGVMAKSPADVAHTLNIILSQGMWKQVRGGVPSMLSKSWKNLRVGVLDPAIWKWDASLAKPNAEVESQILRETRAAYQKIKPLTAVFKDVTLPDWNRLQDKHASVWDVFAADFQNDLNQYLANLTGSPVKSLKELIAWNRANAGRELPIGYSQQDLLEGAANDTTSREKRDQMVSDLRYLSRDQGVEKTLEENEVDVIIGPADSPFMLYTCAGGYPAAVMPLSTLEFNDRPFGLFAVARRNQEHLLVEVMSAWEHTFSPRELPRRLSDDVSPVVE